MRGGRRREGKGREEAQDEVRVLLILSPLPLPTSFPLPPISLASQRIQKSPFGTDRAVSDHGYRPEHEHAPRRLSPNSPGFPQETLGARSSPTARHGG